LVVTAAAPVTTVTSVATVIATGSAATRLAAPVVPERRRTTRRSAGVGADVDLGTPDPDSLHRVELVRGEIRRQLDDRVVEPDRDASDVTAPEPGLVGQGAHDRAGLDVVPLTHGDP